MKLVSPSLRKTHSNFLIRESTKSRSRRGIWLYAEPKSGSISSSAYMKSRPLLLELYPHLGWILWRERINGNERRNKKRSNDSEDEGKVRMKEDESRAGNENKGRQSQGQRETELQLKSRTKRERTNSTATNKKMSDDIEAKDKAVTKPKPERERGRSRVENNPNDVVTAECNQPKRQ